MAWKQSNPHRPWQQSWQRQSKAEQSAGFDYLGKSLVIKLIIFLSKKALYPNEALAAARIKAILKRQKAQYAKTAVEDILRRVGAL